MTVFKIAVSVEDNNKIFMAILHLEIIDIT